MYEFLDRLVNISLPRVRDFRGQSGRAFDGRGNYNMGIKEQIIFPEIDFDPSTRSAAWTSPSPRPPAPTKKPRRCWKRSASRSATDTRGIPKWPRPAW
jgi:hypothetical protein